MKYIVELDTSTKQGTELLRYIQKHKQGKTLSIQKWQKLTPKDIALPSDLVPTDWQWEEYLNRKPGKGKPMKKVFDNIRKRLTTKAE